ncbi:VOC family protein [Pseudoluteimonas lycopersici]|jgi:PhnB protein|uniref:VOC family protein n=1 Tax=Pseudoluteimonas lycopersici TaxID=1324796 RepID=A0A516V5M6_9GAMM|nr:VOC family protein [Lysobacter lycopersici]QDQ73826.1 VOC family protein [Lysobacter lycopersici]
MQFIPYLNFDGNAREAMDFYAAVFGGEVTQRFTYGESPMAEECGPASADHVMHSQLEIPAKTGGSAMLMGADGPPPHEAGSTCVNIAVDTPQEAERIFAALSEGGSVQCPIAETFWAHRFGLLTDKYGKGWLVNCLKPVP